MFSIKAYVAGAFSRRPECIEFAQQLEAIGIEVTSRWLYETCPEGAVWEKFMEKEALMDVEDVLRANIVIRLSDAEAMKAETCPSKLVSGARMFEMGLAIGRGIPVYVVGGKQHVFDRLPSVIHVATKQEMLDRLNIMK